MFDIKNKQISDVVIISDWLVYFHGVLDRDSNGEHV